MTLILVKSGAAFLHVQKTGGTWVREALAAAGVETREVGSSHLDSEAAVTVSDGPRFTIVRNPFTWYQSFWAHRDRLEWGGDLLLGQRTPCTFNEFAMWAAIKYPGFLTEFYGRYRAEYILFTESLVDDLARLLRCLGESFDEMVLRATPTSNRSASLPEYEAATVYSADAAMALAWSEREIIEAYSYEEHRYGL